MTIHRIRLAAIAAAAVLGVSLSACAGPGEAEPDYPVTPETHASFVPVEFDSPEQPPFPPNAEISDEEREALRLRYEDESWQWHVLERFPDAQRPSVPFDGYVSQDERMALVLDCYEGSGVPHQVSLDGTGIEMTSATEGQVIAAFVCDSRFTTEPWGGLTPEQMGWYYDYWVTSYVPCREANGFERNDDGGPMPTRDEYIAQRVSYQSEMTTQVWYPSFDDWSLSEWDREALDEACPYDPLYVPPTS